MYLLFLVNVRSDIVRERLHLVPGRWATRALSTDSWREPSCALGKQIIPFSPFQFGSILSEISRPIKTFFDVMKEEILPARSLSLPPLSLSFSSQRSALGQHGTV